MNALLKQTVSNDFPSLGKLMDDTGSFLEKNGVDSRAAYRINLVLEEMLTNIIKYGYDEPGRREIGVSLEVRDDEVVIMIEDDGHGFNPLQQPETEPAKSPEEREIGGLGIRLIKMLLDHIDYRRENGRNILTIRARRQLPTGAV